MFRATFNIFFLKMHCVPIFLLYCVHWQELMTNLCYAFQHWRVGEADDNEYQGP